MIEGFPDAFEMFEAEDRDAPKDCHIHCMCWDKLGECCDCGDKKPPNQSYRTQGDGFHEEEEDADSEGSGRLSQEISRPVGLTGLESLEGGRRREKDSPDVREYDGK